MSSKSNGIYIRIRYGSKKYVSKKFQNKNYFKKDTILIYVDGCCVKNYSYEIRCSGRRIGVGIYIESEAGEHILNISKEIIYSGSKSGNRAEMYAMIEAMKNTYKWVENLTIYTDSSYIISGLEGNYQDNKNQDLWKDIEFFLNEKYYKIQWIPREHNETATELAKDIVMIYY
uniref:ribonuclease H n=1 Tax=Pithovirus LCDPAC02 TaxID=2506601 RepID=A0A481YRB3_9VIRU|nr:MAG: ribonuclease H [Pithovirus LCDPAC02]